MGRPPLAVNWPLIRSVVENGTSFEKAAAKFGVKYETIRKKAQRESWIMAKTVLKEQISVCPPKTPVLSQRPKKEFPKVSNEEAIALVKESWDERKESSRLLTYHLASKALKEAKLKAPTNWKDAETADKMLRKAVGLESGDSQVNVAMLPNTWGGLQEEAVEYVPVIDSEPLKSENE